MLKIPARISIFGGSGGLGKQLFTAIDEQWRGIQFSAMDALSSKDVDLTFETPVQEYLDLFQPNVVINLAVLNVDSMLHKTSRYDVERQLMVNAAGYASILRHALPKMRERKFGRIIYVSSVLADRPTPGTGIYAACKSFNETLTKVAAKENKAHGITCNVLRLGYFDAGLINRVTPEVKEGITKEAGRLGTVDDLLKGVKFLIESPYVNGAVIKIDGGL